MAETIQNTQIAQELDRIKTAKELIGAKAGTMWLSYKDDEDITHNVVATTPIEDIAEAMEGITVYSGTQDDVEKQRPTAGVTVNKNSVTVQEGFHTYTQVATVQDGHVPSPTITIDPKNGSVTATVTPTEGYIYAIPKSNSSGFDEIAEEAGITPDNIKYGTTIFEIEGSFTGDANIVMVDFGSGYESNYLAEGCTVYAQGHKVVGNLANYEEEVVVNFDPLTEEEHMAFENSARINSLKVNLTPDLLNRLKAI